MHKICHREKHEKDNKRERRMGYRNGKVDEHGVTVDAHCLQKRDGHVEPPERYPQQGGYNRDVSVESASTKCNLE